jgi:23S rRNA (cytosine1962-C5)-methyltransferase
MLRYLRGIIMRNFKKVFITPKGELSIVNGHVWVYVGEVVKTDADINDGDLVDVKSSKDKYLGTGFYNSNSKIRVRLISRNTNDLFDEDFFYRRIKYAITYRLNVMDDLSNCRLIFGEADSFPGLTIDKYNDILVSEVLCLGLDQRKDLIYRNIIKVLQEYGYPINGIYERNDSPIRELEGLTTYKGWYGSNHPTITNTIITENALKYLVDFENGQKTGFFLDQKFNRLLVKRLAKDKNVLDCCTHTGAFAMNAYLGQAKKVTALDISPKAITDAKYNFNLNNMTIETITEDAFTYLRDLPKNTYDFIILDPPAFTKSTKTITNALKGYQELNYLALKKLPRGGFLATASCSHFATEEMFKEAIHKAALRAGVELKLISATGPSYDHPELLGIPETKYLKFFIFQVN